MTEPGVVSAGGVSDFHPTTLTEWESAGFGCRYDLAHGYAEYSLSVKQRAALSNLPELFENCDIVGQHVHEDSYRSTFFSLAGQGGYTDFDPLPILLPSASIAIDVVAKTLSDVNAMRIGVPYPTFDGIPHLLRRAGLELVPFENEYLMANGGASGLTKDLDALFLVLPSNPSGQCLSECEFDEVVRACADYNCILVLDASFRFFSDMHSWDQYRRLASAGRLRAVVIEDTGKTWPAAKLKVASVATSRDLKQRLSVVSNEMILNVSPFTLEVIASLIAAENGPGDLYAVGVIQRNRSLLRQRLAALGIHPVHRESTLSVEWLALSRRFSSNSLTRWLYKNGIAVLPGENFYWNYLPEVDVGRIRISLNRDEAVFESGVSRLCTVLADCTWLGQ